MLLSDSMAAALIGHPGAYYTTIYGGKTGESYTANAIVSPPNPNRAFNTELYTGFQFFEF